MCSKIKNPVDVKRFYVIIRINKVKTLIKHILCDFKGKFDSGTCNSDQKWNNDKCQCKCNKYRSCKKRKIIAGILARVFVSIVSI